MRDALFVAAVLGVMGFVVVLASRDRYGTRALLIALVAVVPCAVLLVGATRRSIRVFHAFSALSAEYASNVEAAPSARFLGA